MRVIRFVRVDGDQSIELTWDDDTTSVVDFEPIVSQGGVFTPLADPAFFAQAALDDRGRVIRWPGDLEFCADALSELGRDAPTR